MKRGRLSDEQIIALEKEQEAGMATAARFTVRVRMRLRSARPFTEASSASGNKTRPGPGACSLSYRKRCAFASRRVTV